MRSCLLELHNGAASRLAVNVSRQCRHRDLDVSCHVARTEPLVSQSLAANNKLHSGVAEFVNELRIGGYLDSEMLTIYYIQQGDLRRASVQRAEVGQTLFVVTSCQQGTLVSYHKQHLTRLALKKRAKLRESSLGRSRRRSPSFIDGVTRSSNSFGSQRRQHLHFRISDYDESCESTGGHGTENMKNTETD